MSVFVDEMNRKWDIRVTVASVRRVKSMLDIDLTDAANPNYLGELIDNPLKIADIIWAIIKPAADTAGVNEDDFADAIAGESIDRATGCLIDSLVEFFPDPKRRVLRQAMNRVASMTGKLADQAMQRMENVDEEAWMESILSGARSGSSLE